MALSSHYLEPPQARRIAALADRSRGRRARRGRCCPLHRLLAVSVSPDVRRAPGRSGRQTRSMMGTGDPTVRDPQRVQPHLKAPEFGPGPDGTSGYASSLAEKGQRSYR